MYIRSLDVVGATSILCGYIVIIDFLSKCQRSGSRALISQSCESVLTFWKRVTSCGLSSTSATSLRGKRISVLQDRPQAINTLASCLILLWWHVREHRPDTLDISISVAPLASLQL